MKKRLILLTMTLSVIMMVGCKSESPSDSVNTYFTTMKSTDSKAVQQLIKNTIPEEALNEAITLNEEESSESTLNESLISYLSKVEAKIVSEKVDNDKATVEVKIDAPNYSDLLLQVMQESEEKSSTGKEVTATDVEKSLSEKIKNSKNETRTGTITLTKKDNEWKIKADDTIANLLLGEANEVESVMFSK